MGLPPGETAPGPQGPAPAADGLAADALDGPDAVDGPETLTGPGTPAGAVGAGRPPSAHRPVVPRPRPTTGDARVDEAVVRLDDLAGLPIAEHLAVFEHVHERLTEALGDLDVHAPAHAGDQPPGPGAPGG